MIDRPTADSERARSAVAVACLRWLEFSGPATAGLAGTSGRATGPATAKPDDSPVPVDLRDFRDRPHPLWDAWLDS